MSMSVDVEIDEDMAIDAVFEILNDAVPWATRVDDGGRLFGTIEGASVVVRRQTPRGQPLVESMYGVRPVVVVSFQPDKWSPYAVSHGGVFNSVLALLKATQGDAVAVEGDAPFLRRLGGQVTLFNEGGVFSPEVQPPWRALFGLPHVLQPRFER